MSAGLHRIFYAGGAVFVFSLAIRLGWQALIPPVQWPDSATYLADGDNLFLHGHTLSFVSMPLYPIFLHVFGAFGPGGALTAQAVVSALSVVLAAWLAWRVIGSWTAAAITAAAMAVYPVLLFYANAMLTETLFTFLLLAAVAAWWERRWITGSVFLVLSILTRPALDMVAPLLLLSVCLAHRERLTVALTGRRLGTYATVYFLLMAPWWIHNYGMYHQFVRLNLGDGITVRLENNPTFDRVGLDFPALLPSLAEDARPFPDPVEANAALKAAAWHYVTGNPGHYLERCIDRLGRFWTPVPGSSKPAINLLSFAVTIPIFLGALGYLLRSDGARWRRVAPMVLLILYLTAVHTVTHALYRYRLPIEPFLIILASGWYADLLRGLPGLGRRGAADLPDREKGLAT
ncbi:MAG: hypothetical protein WCJ64_00225 [Rhodospirillaceae bacterium]